MNVGFRNFHTLNSFFPGGEGGAGAFWYENEMEPLDFEFENLRKASVVTCNYVFNSLIVSLMILSRFPSLEFMLMSFQHYQL